MPPASPRARGSRHLHLDGRLPRQWRGAAAARASPPGRDRGMGNGLRRLSGDPRRRTPRPDRAGRLVAGRLLRAARGGVREAARAVRRLGRQPQLGRSAEAPARAGRGEPGSALLGPRLWVWGERDLDTFIARPRPSTWTASLSRSPCRSSSRTERTTGRSRSPTRSVVRAGGEQPEAGAAISPRTRAPPSTSGSTTSRSRSTFIADWVADTFAELRA